MQPKAKDIKAVIVTKLGVMKGILARNGTKNAAIL
jgi:hypothetical protein